MRFLLGVSLVVAALLVVSSVSGAPGGRFTHRGTVTHVVDGDTVDVRLTGGKRVRVRVLGIDTPERGDCQYAQASARTRALALRKRVVLRGDATQDTRDRYGRLLAYVWLPGGKDLGYQLVRGGLAKVYVFERPFRRVSAYRRAELAAQRAPRGVWKRCAVSPPSSTGEPSVPPPVRDCHPSYTPCLPNGPDLDCADVRALGKAPVRVLGRDSYRLDGDGDGWGCE